MATYSYWEGVASGSGAAGLSNITDATYAGDPAGTDSNKTYWESYAYDQIAALYSQLGTAPGLGVDGSFTINQDASGNETSALSFGTNGALGVPDPNLTWDSVNSRFNMSHDLVSAVNLGTTSTRISSINATNADFSGTLIANTGDFSGAVEIDGVLTLNSTLILSSLEITSNLAIDGTIFTFNDDFSGGSPTEHMKVNVNRGDKTDSALRFLENGDATSRWQAYNLRTGSFLDLLVTDSSGVASWDTNAHPIFDSTTTGSSNKVARADHTHTGGSLAASGTSDTTFTLDDDWISGSVDIELRFANSTHYIKLDPSIGTPVYTFSHGISIGPIDVDDLTVNNDIALTGAISNDLRIDGTDLILDDATGGNDVTISAHIGSGFYRRLRWDSSPGRWDYTNDGTNYFYLVGADSSDDMTLPGDVTITGNVIGSFDATGGTLTMNKGAGAASAYFNVERTIPTTDDRYLKWYETGGKWQLHDGTIRDIVTNTGTQTLTSKSLTSPGITTPTISSGGSWGGNPSFTGVPSFADFTMTSSSTVSNLSASTLDGTSKSSFLYDQGSGKYLATKILDMAGYDIENYSPVSVPAAHQSDHLNGGADALSGTLGQVQGSNYTTWRVNGDAASAGDENTTEMRLGASNSYYISIVDYAGGMLGAGGADVDLVPGTATGNQDIGNASRYWRSAFFDQQIRLNLQGSTPTTDNGSMWFESGSPSAFKVKIGGSNRTIINSDNKTNILGTTSEWSVPYNTKFRLNGSTGTHYMYEDTGHSYWYSEGALAWKAGASGQVTYGNDAAVTDGNGFGYDSITGNWWHYKSGSFLLTQTNGSSAMAVDSSQKVYCYQDFKVDRLKKIYLDWTSETYIKYDSGAANRIEFYINNSYVGGFG